MKKGNTNKIILIALLVSICLGVTACGAKQKNILLNLGDEKKAEDKNKSISMSSKQKDIMVSDDVKKDIGEYEKGTLSLKKSKELNIYDEWLQPICWKDEDNFIAIKGRYDNTNSYDIYNVSISTSKVTRINTIKNSSWNTEITAENSKKMLYLNDLKVYIYDLTSNISKQVFDLRNLKKEIEDENEGYYIRKEIDGLYEIEKRQKDTDPTFNIENDIMFVRNFDINFVKGSNNYIGIISKIGEKGEVVRILDIDTGKVAIKSKAFKDLNVDMSNREGIIYNKSKNTFFVHGKFSNIYELSFDNPSDLKEVKEISQLKGGSSSLKNEKELYFVAKDSNNYSIVRYNLLEDKVTVLQNDMPKGIYFDIKVNNKKGLIIYNYSEPYSYSYNHETFTFIGAIKGDRIKNIQKLPVEKLYEICNNMNSIIFNENGDKFIYKVSYNYAKEDMEYHGAKYYYYEVVK